MPPRQKLELTWIGKDQRPRLEPRILLEDPALTYHAAHRVGPADSFDNRLIFGDNLLALKALEAEFTGQVKCVFIDPPYNTGSAFTHYDDGVEHSVWLTLMRERLELLKRLLRPDGSIWITLDDNEHAYCKVMCDEIFGRQNFVANVIWEKKFSPQSDAKYLSTTHDNILAYSKDKESFKINLLPRSLKQEANFKNPDNDTRGPWSSGDYTCAKNRWERPNLYYPITNPNTGEEVMPKETRVWAFEQSTHNENVANNLLWWGKKGDNPVPRMKKFPEAVKQGMVPTTVWKHDEVGNNQDAKREVTKFNTADPFATPKPERLLHRILTLATNPGDIVLDSFAGSGTTGAVAQKMSRRWIMVELGEHMHTHIIPRLHQVIDGRDAGGVTAATGWTSGGGFRYYRLAPTLLVQDPWGRRVINKALNPAMLAEAVCKLEGFAYAPSNERFWEHGHSSERDFLYVTTQTLTEEQLRHLAEELGPDRTLLVCCAAWRGPAADFPTLTLKKLPQAVLHRCEWGHDDYSLTVANLTEKPAAPVAAVAAVSATAGLPLFEAPAK